MVVDLQQNVESINVTMSCPWGEQPQQLRVTPRKDRRKHKVPAAAETPHILFPVLLRCHCCSLTNHLCPVTPTGKLPSLHSLVHLL